MMPRQPRLIPCLFALLLPAMSLAAPAAASVAPSAAAGGWAALLHRRLHLPHLRPGSRCPTSRARVGHTIAAPFGYGYALGNGPVYPLGFDVHGTLHDVIDAYHGGWYYHKILWMVRPAYRGPVLVRGHQIDGPHTLRFADSDFLASGGVPGGWSGQPSYTMVRASGCYAYQVDGTSFSKVIVFRVTR